jgi:hypothetical protein
MFPVTETEFPSVNVNGTTAIDILLPVAAVTEPGYINKESTLSRDSMPQRHSFLNAIIHHHL